MSYSRNEKIVPINIEDEMQSSYLDYSMSVIVGRALPDVRDGLKPVHRRIIYMMHESGLQHNKPYKKCAKVVGDTLGRLHPHGDSAVYDSLVRMAQSWALRYPFIDGQGNFGSIDGDRAAAYRYTESRLAAITEPMLRDIEKETVNFIPNFDETSWEPTVLPSGVPNLLVNGSYGIAVGMATNIPPHNLTEIVNATVKLLDNPDTPLKDLMKIVKGPDFPTGGYICGMNGIYDAYRTGRGRVIMRARVAREQLKGNREALVVQEIPYQVNKSKLLGDIVALVRANKVTGISDLRDESDRDGMRIVIELKRGENSDVVLNNLYKYTQLQDTFGVIMLALVDGQPRILPLTSVIKHYITHRKEIVVRRTQFDLRKAEEREHILAGYIIALDNIDEVIETIRKSKDTPTAQEKLMKKFGLSEIQAKAILEMRLQRLTGLERDKIEKEHKEVVKLIKRLKAILDSEDEVKKIIKTELLEVRDKFGDERRTEIISGIEGLTVEDLIPEEDVVVTISRAGFIKRLGVGSYRKQRRGGTGVKGMETREEDVVADLFVASTHDYLLAFTDTGRVHWLKVYDIPIGGRATKGRAIVNVLELGKDENVSATMAVRDFNAGGSLIMGTRNGTVKKTALSAYGNPRRGGIIAINLDESDALVDVKYCNEKNSIFIATREGKSILFPSEDVRATGRATAGVRGIKLAKGDIVVAMEVVSEEYSILTMTENGYGKRTEVSEYRLQGRGGSGVINIKTSERNGKVVGSRYVRDDDGVIVITTGGQVIRMDVTDFRRIGRSTQGVIVIRLKDGGDLVTDFAVAHDKDDEALPINGNGNGNSNGAEENGTAEEKAEEEEK